MSEHSQPRSKTIAITGAGRGIGLATARQLAARGHRVIMSDLDGALVATEAEKIGGQAQGFELDVVDRAAFTAHLEMIEQEIGPLDVLINNAGICSASANILEQDPLITDLTIDIDLKGVVNGTVAAIRLMTPRRQGQIVNVASLAGVMGVPGLAAYAAAKFGVVGFTDSVRAEFSGDGLEFTCVMPGPVDTEMMDGTSSSPLVKLLDPEELASGIVEAVEKGRDRVAMRGSSYFLSRLLSILPPAVGIKIGSWTRIDRIYTEITPGARAGYEDRIRR